MELTHSSKKHDQHNGTYAFFQEARPTQNGTYAFFQEARPTQNGTYAFFQEARPVSGVQQRMNVRH